MGTIMQGAFFSFAQVQYVTNDVGYGLSSFFFESLVLSFPRGMLMPCFVVVEKKSYAVRENAGIAQLKIRSKMDNVAGVQLPVFESFSEGADGEIPNCAIVCGSWILISFSPWFLTSTVFELTGLGRGGQQVQQCKKAFKQAVELLVELASMQV